MNIKWAGSLLVTLAILVLILYASREFIHQHVIMPSGAYLFDDPQAGVSYSELRVEAKAPGCNPDADVEATLTYLLTENTDPSLMVERWYPPPTREELRRYVTYAIKDCKQKMDHYHLLKKRETTGLKAFRWLDRKSRGSDHDD